MTAAFEFTADFPTKFFKRTKMPYLSSAKALYLLGTDAASSLANRVPGSAYPTATAVGTPTYSAGYATVNGTTNRIAGGFNSLAGPFTHIFVANVPWTAGNAGCFGGYFTNIAPANLSSAITWEGTGKLGFRLIQPGPSTFLIDLGGYAFNPGATRFAMFAATHDGATMKLYGHNGKRLGMGSAVAANTAVAGHPFVIGGNLGGTSFDVALAATFDSALTFAQLVGIYPYVKELCTARGVAML